MGGAGEREGGGWGGVGGWGMWHFLMRGEVRGGVGKLGRFGPGSLRWAPRRDDSLRVSDAQEALVDEIRNGGGRQDKAGSRKRASIKWSERGLRKMDMEFSKKVGKEVCHSVSC